MSKEISKVLKLTKEKAFSKFDLEHVTPFIKKDFKIGFFTIDENTTTLLMEQATEKWKNSTDLYLFGAQLNQDFSHEDKLDFIYCVFEVAYADGDLHYLEHHTVKKISNILNLHRKDIIAAKAKIESYLE